MRVYGVIDGDDAVCYRYDHFSHGPAIFQDTVFGIPIIVVGSDPDNFMAVFADERNRKPLQARVIKDALPAWFSKMHQVTDMTCSAIVFPARMQAALEAVNGFAAYWFAWVAFYPQTTLR